MSISDMIVVMKTGVIQQVGRPQDVYDSPINLFVAKFLGTPPINVFHGEVKDGRLYIGEDNVCAVKGIANKPVWVGIRPEGFELDDNGTLSCSLTGVEVMGRDITVISNNAMSDSGAIRSIISAENRVDTSAPVVRFNVKPYKLFLFDKETEARLDCEIG